MQSKIRFSEIFLHIGNKEIGLQGVPKKLLQSGVHKTPGIHLLNVQGVRI